MKKLTVLFALLVTFALSASAQVAISTDNSSPASSAMLEVKSSTKGMLVPRMTTSQIELIASPADGLMVYCTTDHKIYVYDVSSLGWRMVQYGSEILVQTVTGSGGRTWMAINLGASEVATSKTDANAYGDLYQWGRAAEGHQKRNSPTIATQATSAEPNPKQDAWYGKFITNTSSQHDWLATPNNNLWQGVSGTNNPCPSGFRIPTQTEWNSEGHAWEPNRNDNGAFASPLKITDAGFREKSDGSLQEVGNMGFYWTSTTRVKNGVDYTDYMRINSAQAYVNYVDDNFTRCRGASVRCIKD